MVPVRDGKVVPPAGCVLRTFPEQGRSHTLERVKYRANPPTSGPHHPVPAADGVYAPGGEPQVEKWVHSLAHGRVLIQYRPGTTTRRIRALRSLFNERLL
jgi:hypothetical protein